MDRFPVATELTVQGEGQILPKQPDNECVVENRKKCSKEKIKAQ